MRRDKLILVLCCTLIAAIIFPYQDCHWEELLFWFVLTIQTVYSLLFFVVLFRKDAWRHVSPADPPKRMRYALIAAAILLLVLPYPRFYVQRQCVRMGIPSSLDVPWGVTHITADAFFIGCDNLTSFTGITSITIPDSVTSIGDGAFGCCENLRSITIPRHFTYPDVKRWCVPSGCKIIRR